jgi:hypothetical protein
MNLRTIAIILLLALGCILFAAPVSAEIPPGGTGWIAFKTNVNGASVYINGNLKGTTDSTGEFDIQYVDTFTTYTISKAGYYDGSGSIDFPPGADNLDITETLTLKPTGSGKGWFAVHSNVDGATVAFDGSTKGTISGGVFSYEVTSTAAPFSTYSVSRNGYQTYLGSISTMPSEGQTIDLYATLNPVTTQATTYTTPIGGDVGWYAVTCNVDGASVYFDSVYKGVISGGVLNVQVYTTGTPYRAYSVSKSGYVSVTGTLPAAPAKGKTVTVPVTLVPLTSATTEPTYAPVGSEHGWIAFHCNVDGAKVTMGDYNAGVIRNGVLTVSVATTGTPYSAFTVTKDGYATTTGTVPRQPSAGETVDVYVTMTAVSPTPLPTTQSPLPVPVIVSALAIAALVVAGIRAQRE